VARTGAHNNVIKIRPPLVFTRENADMLVSVLDESFKPTSLRVMEYFFITRTLEATNGNKSQAAKLLGISRQTLREKLKGFEGAQAGPVQVAEAAARVDL
jgi:DNA-binding NtrC family response regulator